MDIRTHGLLVSCENLLLRVPAKARSLACVANHRRRPHSWRKRVEGSWFGNGRRENLTPPALLQFKPEMYSHHKVSFMVASMRAASSLNTYISMSLTQLPWELIDLVVDTIRKNPPVMLPNPWFIALHRIPVAIN